MSCRIAYFFILTFVLSSLLGPNTRHNTVVMKSVLFSLIVIAAAAHYDPCGEGGLPEEKKCDGIRDCADGRDEDYNVCQDRSLESIKELFGSLGMAVTICLLIPFFVLFFSVLMWLFCCRTDCICCTRGKPAISGTTSAYRLEVLAGQYMNNNELSVVIDQEVRESLARENGYCRNCEVHL